MNARSPLWKAVPPNWLIRSSPTRGSLALLKEATSAFLFNSRVGVQFTKAHPALRAAFAYSSEDESDPDEIRLRKISAPACLRRRATSSVSTASGFTPFRWGARSPLEIPGETRTRDFGSSR